MAKTPAQSTVALARKLIVEAALPHGVETESAFAGAEAAAADSAPYVPTNIPPGISADEVAATSGKIVRREPLDSREEMITEAIILPDLRPAVDVIADNFEISHPLWTDYVSGEPAHQTLVNGIPAVGRIEIIVIGCVEAVVVSGAVSSRFARGPRCDKAFRSILVSQSIR